MTVHRDSSDGMNPKDPAWSRTVNAIKAKNQKDKALGQALLGSANKKGFVNAKAPNPRK